MKIPPIMVHTMAKVGTVSFVDSLSRAGYHVWQAHWLSAKKYPNAEFPTGGQPGMDARIKEDRMPDTILFVPVREPVGRSLSAYMQARNRFGDPQTAALMYEKATQEYEVEWADKWFEKELKGLWGFDAFEYPFNHEQGYEIYEHGRHKVIIVRLEDADRVFRKITANVLDGPLELLHSNSWKFRLKGLHSLEEFERMKKMPMPKEYLDRCYALRYAQHFYTDEERAEFRRSWENGSE